MLTDWLTLDTLHLFSLPWECCRLVHDWTPAEKGAGGQQVACLYSSAAGDSRGDSSTLPCYERHGLNWIPWNAADWLMTGVLQKMVLVVSSVASKEVLERWTFDIQTDRDVLRGG
jgi:hypothetical protein